MIVKTIIESIRALVLSFEMLAFVILLCLFLSPLDFFVHLGNVAISKYQIFLTAMAVVLVFSFVISRKILTPNGEMNKVLQKWPGYWRLKIRVYVANGVYIACLISACVATLFKIPTDWAGYISLSALVIAGISFLSICLAAIKIGEFEGQLD